jgi:sigma54-dependent transcription regulator
MQFVDLELSLFDKILASLTEEQKQKLSELSDCDSEKINEAIHNLIFNELI